jgi:hypothetical protein
VAKRSGAKKSLSRSNKLECTLDRKHTLPYNDCKGCVQQYKAFQKQQQRSARQMQLKVPFRNYKNLIDVSNPTEPDVDYE